MTPSDDLKPAAGEAGTPLFIPLTGEFYDAFANGSKTEELRRYGPRWNERTCPVGRAVVELPTHDGTMPTEFDDWASQIIDEAGTKADSQVQWEIVEALQKAWKLGRLPCALPSTLNDLPSLRALDAIIDRVCSDYRDALPADETDRRYKQGMLNIREHKREASTAREAVLLTFAALRAQRAAVPAALRAPREWQPIETAPTDGTIVLLFTDRVIQGPALLTRQHVAVWNGSHWQPYIANRWTHWMTLPDPPAAADAASRRPRTQDEETTKEHEGDTRVDVERLSEGQDLPQRASGDK